MSKRFRRFYNKSLKEVNEIDDKNVDIIESADGSVTVVKKEEIRKNYRNNKLIKNDEDSKIIQDFCRKHLRFSKKNIKEEKVEDVKKEEETQSTSKRGYYSRYKKNKNQQENQSSNISPEKKNNINENTDKNNNNQTEQNKEETNSGRKYYRRRFFKKSEETNQKGSPEENSSNQNKINVNSISTGKDKNEIEENKSPLRYKRKKHNSEEKKEQIEEKKPKFVPTYHEKKKYVGNDSQFGNKNFINLKNYKCQEIEAIPVKFCNDYDYGYGYSSRMRFLSPVKTLYVQPFLNPNIIITKIKLDDNFIQSSNIGYASGINNNIYSYRNNFSRNDTSYKNNNNLFGRNIFKSQYKTEYKYMHPFPNIDNSRNVGI